MKVTDIDYSQHIVFQDKDPPLPTLSHKEVGFAGEAVTCTAYASPLGELVNQP